MKKFVMYGAGNIGRGFIGQLFSQAGYQIQFIDVNMEIINALNTQKRYPISVLSNEGSKELWVENVIGINGMDVEAVVQAISTADMMATAIGVNILPRIVPNIVAGIKKRIVDRNPEPLNIIICENLIDADKMLRTLICEQLTQSEIDYFEKNVGLVEASIGRMVPIMTEEMKNGNPLRVCVEKYGELPVDKAAFKGTIPNVAHLFPYSPFEFYIKRKLYIHNMGHCLTAFLGNMLGLEYIWQAIANPTIKIIVQRAMTESAVALSKKFDVPLEELLNHVTDLLLRFANVELGDTNERVGKDIVRKLSDGDRFIGTINMIEDAGNTPVYVPIGVDLGLALETRSETEAEAEAEAKKFLSSICKMNLDHSSYERIIIYYNAFRNNITVERMLELAEKNMEEILNQKILI